MRPRTAERVWPSARCAPCPRSTQRVPPSRATRTTWVVRPASVVGSTGTTANAGSMALRLGGAHVSAAVAGRQCRKRWLHSRGLRADERRRASSCRRRLTMCGSQIVPMRGWQCVPTNGETRQASGRVSAEQFARMPTPCYDSTPCSCTAKTVYTLVECSHRVLPVA